jgi:general stress protein YciG
MQMKSDEKSGVGKNRCQGRTKSNQPCRAAATSGGLCFFHANPNKASELGRKGGRSKRQVMLHDADQLPALNSAESVRNFIARLTAEVYSGEKHPSLARGLAALLVLQLRVLHDADVEERLAILEEKLAKSDEISRDPENPDSANGGTGGGSVL